MLSHYRRLPTGVKASLWFLVCSFLQRGISVISTPIFTRLLSTAEYGQYSIFNSWLSVAQAVVTLNICYGQFAQGIVKFSDDRPSYVSSMQGLALTLTSAWTIFYIALRDFVNSWLGLTTPQVLCMLVMVWATTCFNFWSAVQRVDLKYHSLVALTLAVSVLKPLVGVIMVLSANDRVTARILGLALVEFAGYSWIFFLHLSRGKQFYSKKYWKYALVFCLPLLPHYLSQVVLSSMDRVMIGWFEGDSAAGIYSLAYSISQVMTLFNTAISQTFEPWLYKNIRAKNVRQIGDVTFPAMLLIACVNLLLIAFAPEAVAIFASEEYQDAIWVIPPVSISVFYMFCYTYFVVFEFYYERQGFVLVATASGAIINILLNYLLIPSFGYLIAGYTTLLSYAIYALLHYIFMCKICDEELDGVRPYDGRRIATLSVAFTVLGLSFLLTYEHPMVRYVYVFVLLFIAFIRRDSLIGYVKQILEIRTEGRTS